MEISYVKILQIKYYIEKNDLSYDEISKLSLKYKDNLDIQGFLGIKLFKQSKYELALIWFYFLYRKYKIIKYKYIVIIIEKQIEIEESSIKNMLRDDHSNATIKNIFDLYENINIPIERVHLELENTIIDTEDIKLYKNDLYKDKLRLFKIHCVEQTNFDLINYLIDKQLFSYTTATSEFRFIHKMIIFNLNKRINERAL